MGRRPRTVRLACKHAGCIRMRVVKGYCNLHHQRRLNPPAKEVDRFWSKVDKRGPNDCWPWKKALFPEGYGAYLVKPGQTRRAHRLAYAYTVGPIPDGLQLDHMCHDPELCKLGNDCPHRRCCNPAHLRPSTNLENNAPDRSNRARGIRVTHCPQGHEFTPENTRTDPYGGRHCRACDRKR